MIYTVTLNPSFDRTLYLDHLAVSEVNRAQATRIDLGGKGVNVSRALQRLGVKSVALGFAGGVSGKIFESRLRELGVECDFTPLPGEMRSNITVIDWVARQTTKLNEPGPEISAADLAKLEARLVSHVQPGDFVTFCGNLPPGTPADTYSRLISAAGRCGAETILDSSGAALADGCSAQPGWLKPNLAELESLIGSACNDLATSETALASLFTSGIRYVLLTAGEQGAVFASGHEAWLATPPGVVAESTVGAGDAALAGALYARQNGAAAGEITRWAAAAGTAAVMQEGSEMPSLNQVCTVYKKVKTRLLYQK